MLFWWLLLAEEGVMSKKGGSWGRLLGGGIVSIRTPSTHFLSTSTLPSPYFRTIDLLFNVEMTESRPSFAQVRWKPGSNILAAVMGPVLSSSWCLILYEGAAVKVR